MSGGGSDDGGGSDGDNDGCDGGSDDGDGVIGDGDDDGGMRTLGDSAHEWDCQRHCKVNGSKIGHERVDVDFII